jgi:glycosyltransferase involved in cell wall biosynthesis
MIGGGSQREALVRAAEGVSTIQILDALPEDEFQTALQAADVLLVHERPGVAGMAVPSKLTSYFSSGRPVLAATDPGSVTESEVLRARAGLVVRAGDPIALVAAAEALGRDGDRAAALGAAGLAFRREHLSQAAALDSYAQILAELRESGTRARQGHRQSANTRTN